MMSARRSLKGFTRYNPHISVDSRQVLFLLWVYSFRLSATHLRCGRLSRGLRRTCWCSRKWKTNPSKSISKGLLSQPARSSGWHCEFWKRLWGPKVPRSLHTGHLTLALVEEYNFWIHCLEQQLPKNIRKLSK